MENTYKNQTIGEKIKSGLKNAVIAYAVLGSLYMLPYTLESMFPFGGGTITGHRSADLHLKENPVNTSFTRLSRLEKAILKPICDKVGCDVNEIDKPSKNK